MMTAIKDAAVETQIKSLCRAQQELSKARALPLDDDSTLEIQAIMAHIVVMIGRLEERLAPTGTAHRSHSLPKTA